MARFYASIQGQAKTEATRRGSAKSGIRGHIRGWEGGVLVVGSPAGSHTGEFTDRFVVYMTTGSNGADPGKLLGHVIVDGNGPRWEAA